MMWLAVMYAHWTYNIIDDRLSTMFPLKKGVGASRTKTKRRDKLYFAFEK